MLQPNQFALFFTVALLAITAYFLLGSVPLLILKHDNPVDSRFIRSFYITYFRMAFVAAVGTDGELCTGVGEPALPSERRRSPR
jgi:hypothetical protein